MSWRAMSRPQTWTRHSLHERRQTCAWPSTLDMTTSCPKANASRSPLSVVCATESPLKQNTARTWAAALYPAHAPQRVRARTARLSKQA
jgi:hypothetical protein